jgi:hypothetical protein
MRFAYIDTRGNEVTIPSVDALRLRIELGAILDDTQFHDANTGKWAPAMEHEIFRTLKRELEELDAGGFAPPPPGMVEGSAVQLGDAPPRDAPPSEAGDAPPPAPADADDFGLGMELEVAPEGVERDGEGLPASGGYTVEGDAGESVLDGLGGIELAGDWGTTEETGGADGVGSSGGAEGGDDGASSALAGLEEGGLELEAPLEPGEPTMGDVAPPDPGPGVAGEAPGDASAGDAPGAPERFAMSPQEDLMGSVPEPGLMGDADTMGSPEDLASMRLEPTLDDDGFPPEDAGMAGDLGGLEMETPLSEYEADQPPAWTQEGGVDSDGVTGTDGYGGALGGEWEDPDDPWGDDEPAEWGEPGGGEEWGGPDVPPPPVRGEPPARPRSRPRNAPPQRKLTRARTPGAGRVFLLVAAIVAVGAGGWYGYQTFLGGGAGGAGQGAPLPQIPTALMPRMSELSDRAVSGMVEELGRLPERSAIPDRPDPDWLSGPYLAGASGYAGIPEYWASVEDYLSAAEAAARDLFAGALEAEISGADLPASDADLLRDRAMAGWDAAAPDRGVIFDQLRAVIRSALELHQFLVMNEGQIQYEPVGPSASPDARLDARATSPQVAEAMRSGVDAITDALDDLGYLDTIRTDGLVNTFLASLEATPIR